jgi:hypothetical protein
VTGDVLELCVFAGRVLACCLVLVAAVTVSVDLLRAEVER